MRILCISAQKPDSTGSGVYLAETVASMAAAGHQVAVIAGIDKDDSPQLAPGVEFFPVRFRTPELPFPVVGMSDVMPYEATRYRDMTPEMVQAFRSAFGQRIRQAVIDFKPDAIICHHLYLACSTACDVLDDLSGENRLPAANGQGGQAANSKGRPCPIWGVCHSTDLRQLRNHDLEKDRITAAVRSLDGVMALHEAQKAEIAELFDLPADRIRVVGTGYNPRSSLLVPACVPPARCVCCMSGRSVAPRAWKALFAPWTCCRSIRRPWSYAWSAAIATRCNTIASSNWPAAAVSQWCSAVAFRKTTWCFLIIEVMFSSCPRFSRGCRL